jgi:hypothetical protein
MNWGVRKYREREIFRTAVPAALSPVFPTDGVASRAQEILSGNGKGTVPATCRRN